MEEFINSPSLITDTLLFIIVSLLAYMSHKIRGWDKKINRMDTALFGMDEVEQVEGVVDTVGRHERALRQNGIIPVERQNGGEEDGEEDGDDSQE